MTREIERAERGRRQEQIRNQLLGGGGQTEPVSTSTAPQAESSLTMSKFTLLPGKPACVPAVVGTCASLSEQVKHIVPPCVRALDAAALCFFNAHM